MAEVLQITDLVKEYAVRGATPGARAGTHRAVDGVSLTIGSGETVALVGQSGSGKTTIGRLVTGLERPTSGRIVVAGHEITSGRKALRDARSSMQMVFQDPYESLDSRMTVLESVLEPLLAEKHLTNQQRHDLAHSMLAIVELTPTESFGRRRPYELSGGQRQRVAIARAMVGRPQLVVADEPVSMLDVSIRATVLDLFHKVQVETGVSYLFITHDLLVAQHVAHHVAVMTEGRIVEFGDSAQIMRSPQHDYTKSLLAAAPRLPTVVDGSTAVDSSTAPPL